MKLVSELQKCGKEYLELFPLLFSLKSTFNKLFFQYFSQLPHGVSARPFERKVVHRDLLKTEQSLRALVGIIYGELSCQATCRLPTRGEPSKTLICAFSTGLDGPWGHDAFTDEPRVFPNFHTF